MNKKIELAQYIEDKKDLFVQVSDAVWEAAEVRFATEKSVKSFSPY